jgi:hypothetical protein
MLEIEFLRFRLVLSMAKKKTTPVPVLKGWTAIAMFLGTSRLLKN